MSVRILTETELRRLVPLDLDVIDAVAEGFRALAGGAVVMPPILSMEIEDFNGEVDVKTAYVPGVPSFAIKVSPGFFDNPKLGLPSTSGLMILFSARTGRVEALLLDNGYLTDVRTAAAGAVAARALAREDAARRGDPRHRAAGAPAAARAGAGAADPKGRVLGPRPGQGRGGGTRDGRGARHRRPRGARRGGGGGGGGRDRDDHAGPHADPDGRLAAAGAARHGDGLGPAVQERARARLPRPRRPLRARPPEPDAGARRAAQRHRGRRGRRRPGLPELGEVIAGRAPGRKSTRRSPSPT
jgi:hypothetical protein